MKKIIIALLLLPIMITYGCKSNNDNLSIRVKETEAEYVYNAIYPQSKTDALENYINKTLKNELPMNQHIDVTVNLVNGEPFKIKASEGVLQIQFDKRNNSVAGFIKVKQFTDGIGKVLTGK